MSKASQYNSKSLYFTELITEAMNGLLDYPLTIVEAPMGYGKTTFMRETLKNIDADILWQKVYDDSISGFWKGFCRQLGEVDSGRSLSLAALGFPNDSTTRYEALSLIEEIELQKDTVLVIDDYHAVACPETNHFIEFLVNNEIPYLHLILIARYTGLQGIEELMLKGYLLHIKKEAFEFSNKDIKAYYHLCGIYLKEHEARMLCALTEGWISALYLIMLNYQENGSLDTSKDIGKLIENAVYRHFSEEIKIMLLSLCIFEGFNLEQAVYVSKNENAKSLLAEVISKNAFVKYDSSSKTYQIHNIFMNFLQEEFENRNIQNDLYQRAAQWFLKIGDYNLAQYYFYLCKDFENIYLTLEKEKHAAANYVYKKDMLIKFFRECPHQVKEKRHLAMLVLAFELYTYNEMELFNKAFTEFLENLQRDESITDEDRNRLLGEYELLMSFTVYNDLRKMSLHHLRACELLKEPSSLLPRSGIWTFGSPSVLYMFYRESEKLEDAIESMFYALPHYSRATDGNANGGEYCLKAEGYFYRGDFENALITSHRAIHRAKSKKQVSNVICALFLIMRVTLWKGDFAYVLELLQRMREEIAAAKEYLLLHTAEICEGYIYSLLNQSHRIPKWLEEGDYSSDRLLFPNYAMLNIVYGRVLLIKGEYHKLIGSMDNFIGIASVFPNLLGQIHTYIYVAAANRRIFRQSEALAFLKQALDLALPDKLYIPFVENCDYIKPLLEELLRESCYCEDIERILKLYETYQKAFEMIEKEHFIESRPKLSEREMEIARLAADGVTNKEIGEKLFITANTVKTALKTIYAKLSLNNRTLLKQYLEAL